MPQLRADPRQPRSGSAGDLRGRRGDSGTGGFVAGRPQVSPGAGPARSSGGAAGVAWGAARGSSGPACGGHGAGSGAPLAVAPASLLQVTGKKSHPFFVYFLAFLLSVSPPLPPCVCVKQSAINQGKRQEVVSEPLGVGRARPLAVTCDLCHGFGGRSWRMLRVLSKIAWQALKVEQMVLVVLIMEGVHGNPLFPLDSFCFALPS